MSVLERVREVERMQGAVEPSAASLRGARERLKADLVDRLGLDAMAGMLAGEGGARARAELSVALESALNTGEYEDVALCDRARLVDQVLDEVCGLGPIQPLLEDDSITEVMINGCDALFYERGGEICQAETRFDSPEQIMIAIDRILAPLGRRLDRASPLVSARLPNGDRVNAVADPISIDGPSITIRKFSDRAWTLRRLVGLGALPAWYATLLSWAVRTKCGIAVAGGTGSGKTTLILESLVPALAAQTAGKPLPPHVRAVEADGIAQVKLIDATPIGINVRSTVATYANVHDELRKVFARTPDAKRLGYKAGDFSYNTGKLRCPVCDGTGVISLDVQFLPDVEIPCTGCRGSRYSRDADAVRHENRHGGTCTLPQLMDMDINTALTACTDLKLVTQRLKVLQDLGLGYLTLGEETPSLSGGEAQRLKLASEMGRAQHDTVFVFDEPTIGLHPLDVRTLLGVFRTLIENGATVIVIEHDLDVIRSADYLIDMGPGGGEEGGRVVACGTPAEVKRNPESRTGKFI